MRIGGLFYLVVLVTLMKSRVDAAHAGFSVDTQDVGVSEFYRLAVDPVSGTVFVGARNRLHQLDADLRPLRTVMTGPRLDNRRCTESFGEARCGAGGTTIYDARPTDNVNKVPSTFSGTAGIRV